MTVRDGGTVVGTGVTDETGCVDIEVGSAGSYEVTVEAGAAGLPTTSRTMAVACGANRIRLCNRCEDCVLSTSNKTVTFSTAGAPVVRTLVWSAFLGGWFATVSGAITAKLYCRPGEAYGWTLRMTYDDPESGSTSCDLLLEGTCDPVNFTVIDLDPCDAFTTDTGLRLPITITA